MMIKEIHNVNIRDLRIEDNYLDETAIVIEFTSRQQLEIYINDCIIQLNQWIPDEDQSLELDHLNYEDDGPNRLALFELEDFGIKQKEDNNE